MLISEILQYFSWKNVSVFGYKVIKDLTSWPLNELVKLTMLWTTGPCSLGSCIAMWDSFWIKYFETNDDDIQE